MNKELSMDEMEQRVLLLGLYKKQNDETFNDVLLVMENSKVFTKKVGKQYLKNLQELNYITTDSFTMIGIQKAQEIEKEFKL